jgi:1,4-alpha-glucan branching enzyme
VAPDADSVSVIGTFSDWQPVPMTFDAAHGAWSVSLPVPVGNHQYQYVLNGTTHVTDPRAPQANGDFGSPNSVLTISAR